MSSVIIVEELIVGVKIILPFERKKGEIRESNFWLQDVLRSNDADMEIESSSPTIHVFSCDMETEDYIPTIIINLPYI